MKKILQLLSLAFLLISNNNSQTVNFSIDLTKPLTPISPYIYGTNEVLTGTEGWTAFRLGGNRMTGYNWENNASNAGADWYHSSDDYMLGALKVPDDRRNEAGAVSSVFHELSQTYNAYTLLTLQLAGYVAKDMNGLVSEADKAPSSRWVEVKPEKGSILSLDPDLNDNFVYMDEYVNYNVDKFGDAVSTGIRGYSLDNEPALWPSTHARIHPDKTLCKEIVDKAIAYSKAVKNIDPGVEIFGPALYGFAAYTEFQSAPDWGTVKSGKDYNWFIDYYLDEMKKAEDAEGKRLLDVLDLHWYPEAKGDHRIVDNDANTQKDKNARVQAPRTLWDSRYIENSWIGQWGQSHLPLIPKLKASINKYYPGTKLGFTEITYGGPNDISGGIATCDMLGIMAKYEVYFTTLWPLTDNAPYFTAAYKMFTNYDRNKSTFGNLYAYSKTSDSVNTSLYGSISAGKDQIHIIAINKNFSNSYTANFSVSTDKSIIDGKVYYIDKDNSSIKFAGDITNIQNNSFTSTLPAASVAHYVLRTSEILSVDDKNIPTEYKLSAFPNPFNPSCRLDFTIPGSDEASMEIFDITGRLIKSFIQLKGTGQVTWEGLNNFNQPVSSGMYIAILKGTNDKFLTQKIMLLK